MPFDLTTAIPVRTREDGLLEKDTFDLSTARPVAEISMDRNARYSPPLSEEQKAQAVVELQYKEQGKKVPFGLQADWTLTSKPAKLVTSNILGAMASGGIIPLYNIAKGIVNAESPNSDIGKMVFDSAYKGLAENQKVENLGSAAQKAYPDLPWQITGSIGALAEVLMFMPGVVKGGAELLSKDKQFTIALNNARQSPKWGDLVTKVSEKSGKPIEEVDAALYNTLWKVRKESNPFVVLNTNLKKATGIDLFSETGQISIKRAKVGQIVNFKDPQGLIKTGKITELVGERATINLEGKEVIATLSQLNLPKAPKKPVLPAQVKGEEKVYYHGTNKEFNSFDLNKSMAFGKSKFGHWFTENKEFAEIFGKNIKEATLNIQNPKIISKTEWDNIRGEHAKDGEWFKSWKQNLIKQGYDGLKVKGSKEMFAGKEVINPTIIAAFEDSQIKLSTPTIEPPKISETAKELPQPPPIETPPQTPIPPETETGGIPEEPKKPIININRLDMPEESKEKIVNISDEIRENIEKTTGKPLTHAEVIDAAVSSDILTKVIDRTQSKEFEAALLRTRQHLSALASEQGVSEDFIKTLKTVKAFSTDTARKLGSFRINAGAEEYNIKTKIVNELNEMGVEIDNIVKESQGVDFNDQEQVTEFYRKFVKPKLWDLLSEYRYINLLSSPKTHIVNAFSNLLQVSGLAPATKLASGAIDAVHGMFKPGLERTHYVSEVPAYLKGALNSVGEAGNKALDAFRGKSFVERPDVKHIPTGSKLLKPFRYIPQALEASDVFFRTISYYGELESQLAKDIPLEEAKAIAKDKASYWVFRKALDPKNKTGQGALLSGIDGLTALIYKTRNLPVVGKPISWFLPFVQTPMNIAKQMIEFSPFGGATIPKAKDKTEQLAKALIGTFITATTAYIISEQDSTWSMPSGKKEKELFLANGRQPYSIKLGDKWYSYSRLGPVGLPIAIAAASKWYLIENPNSATENTYRRFINVLGGLGSYFSDQSYVQGIGDLVKVSKGEPGSIPKAVNNFPSQLIPLSALQRWVNNIIDPVYRKTDKEISPEAIVENAKKSIIGMTKGLEAYKDINDEESKRDLPMINAFSPINVSKEKKDYGAYKDYQSQKREDLIDKQDKEFIRKPRIRRIK